MSDCVRAIAGRAAHGVVHGQAATTSSSTRSASATEQPVRPRIVAPGNSLARGGCLRVRRDRRPRGRAGHGQAGRTRHRPARTFSYARCARELVHRHHWPRSCASGGRAVKGARMPPPADRAADAVCPGHDISPFSFVLGIGCAVRRRGVEGDIKARRGSRAVLPPQRQRVVQRVRDHELQSVVVSAGSNHAGTSETWAAHLACSSRADHASLAGSAKRTNTRRTSLIDETCPRQSTARGAASAGTVGHLSFLALPFGAGFEPRPASTSRTSRQKIAPPRRETNPRYSTVSLNSMSRWEDSVQRSCWSVT